MEDPTQRACLNLILAHMPESVRESPLVLEFADESMKHIKGGDSLQTLCMRCILQVLTNLAQSNEEKWVNYLKNTLLENFTDCFFKSHPKIMISILNQCPLGPAIQLTSVEVIVELKELHVMIDGQTFIQTTLSTDNQEWMQWVAYVIRRFHLDGAIKIVIGFNTQGIDENESVLKNYQKQVFYLMHTMDCSKGISDYPLDDAKIGWKYHKRIHTVSIDARGDRSKDHRFFTTFFRYPSNPRPINNAFKEDFTHDFIQ
ncbi:unnamed protein product [Caenorhabditis brenneri]